MAALKNARQTCKDINNLLDKIRLLFSEWELTLENKPTTEDIKKELKKALSKKLPTKVIPAKVARVGFFDRLDIKGGERVERTAPKYKFIGTHAGGDEMDRSLRLQSHEALYRYCREDQGRCHEDI